MPPEPPPDAPTKPSVAVPQPQITVSPRSIVLSPGATQPFTAAVTGTSETSVRWSAEAGTITPDGVYTAPLATGTYQVVVRTRAEPAASAQATVSVVETEPIVVTVTPGLFSLGTGEKHQFTASVTGSADASVTWSADGGEIDSSGLYSAPASAGTYHVVARSHADPSRSAEATVEVTASPTIAVTIEPETITLVPGETHKFVASVTGTSDASVDWSTDAGSIDSSGLYTPPTQAGVAHVKATSHADPTRSASATVTIQEPAGVSVTVDPASTEVPVGGSMVFHVSVSGTSDTRVTWSVTESTGGSVDETGSYTAPTDSRGVFHVVATSVADPSSSASAAVTVQYEDLIDHGAPVSAANRVFALWWGPQADFPADARPAMESLFSAIDGTSYLAIADQYLRGARASVAFAGSLYDASVPPDDASGGPPVADAACRALAAAGVSPQTGDMVFVYTSNFPTDRTGFCAWHGVATCEGVQIPISYVPNPEGTICASLHDYGCSPYSAATRSLSRATTHELFESMLNPVGSGWSDWQYAEIADKCMQMIGCVDLQNGVRLQLSGLYSNAVHACTLSGN